MQISMQQLAEILVGISRSQAAVVQALDKETGGLRGGHAIPALQGVARLRDHAAPTLTDLPARLLLNCLEGSAPDAISVARELERLCRSSEARAPSGGPGSDLDFGAPPP